ncbi:ribonuclease P protein component [Halocynthiibacter namhaensis]|uniref:ribonuclease P protein component n=1 Tax=Halocynthiibacter namhaensis TaxID=1290553 RepID=UPI00068DCEA0
MITPNAEMKVATAEVETPTAVSACLSVLQKRRDFLKVARAKRAVAPAFILQMRTRQPDEADGMRIGYTCSKKVGNAVARNRAKRRLREIARLELPESGRDGCDYVLIGRAKVTAERDFLELRKDLRKALGKLHNPKPARPKSNALETAEGA